jgi:hypothetical protein
VTDSEGKLVRGLTRDDFVIKEDKTAQNVLSFDYFDGALPSHVPKKLPTLRANTFVNLPSEPERGPLCVLYYGMVNTYPEDQANCHKARAGTRIALTAAKPSGQ